MNQNDIAESVGRHLDALADLLRWGLLLACVFLWGAYEGQNELAVAAMKVTRVHIPLVGVCALTAANVIALILILRIGSLLELADDDHVLGAVSRAALHPWLLNPFAYFGTGFGAYLHSEIGFGSLVFIWWVCESSFLPFFDNQIPSLKFHSWELPYWVIGIALAGAIIRTYLIVLERTAALDPPLHRHLRASEKVRLRFMYVGIGLGVLFHLGTLFLL